MNVDAESGPLIVCRTPLSPASEECDVWAPARHDQNYFRAREQAERAAAKAAASNPARRIHQELAQLYAGLARRSDQAAR
jgi:hypothetical protein